MTGLELGQAAASAATTAGAWVWKWRSAMRRKERGDILR